MNTGNLFEGRTLEVAPGLRGRPGAPLHLCPPAAGPAAAGCPGSPWPACPAEGPCSAGWGRCQAAPRPATAALTHPEDKRASDHPPHGPIGQAALNLSTRPPTPRETVTHACPSPTASSISVSEPVSGKTCRSASSTGPVGKCNPDTGLRAHRAPSSPDPPCS